MQAELDALVGAHASATNSSSSAVRQELASLRGQSEASGAGDRVVALAVAPVGGIAHQSKRVRRASAVAQKKHPQYSHLHQARVKALEVIRKRPAAASNDGNGNGSRPSVDILSVRQAAQGISVPSRVVHFLQQPIAHRHPAHQHYRELSPLAPCVTALSKFCASGHRATRKRQIKVVRFYAHYLGLGKRKFKVVNRSAMAESCDVEYHNVLQRLVRLAELCIQQCRVTRWLIEFRLANSALEYELLVYLECDRNDETPMWCNPINYNVGQMEWQQKPEVASDPPSKAFDDALRRLIGQLPQMLRESYNKAVCKLLNAELKYAALIRRTADSVFIRIRGGSLSWIQHVDKNSARTYCQAERERSASSRHVDAFTLPCRLTCQDRYAANKKQERETMAEDRPVNRHSCAFDCRAHMLNGGKPEIRKRLVPATTSGVKNFALSVRGGTLVQLLEQSFVDTIMDPTVITVRINSGTPPESALPFKRCVIGATMGRGRRQVQRRLALEALPNGAWDIDGVLDVWVRPGLRVDRFTLAKTIATALACLIVRGYFAILDEGRWKNAGDCLSRIIMGFAVSGILVPAYKLFAQRVRSSAPRGAAPLVDDDGHLPMPLLALDDEPPVGAAVDAAAKAKAAPKAIATERKSAFELEREEADKARSTTLSWIDDEPLGTLYLMKLVFDLYEEANDMYVWMSGKNFETRQQGLVAHGIAQGMSNEDAMQLRTFPVVEAAKHSIDGKFKSGCSALLLDYDKWDPIMRGKNRSVSHRGLCFRVLSMAECGVHDTIWDANEKCPAVMFLALVSDEGAARVEALSECLKSRLLKAIIAMCPDGLRGRIGRAVLTTFAAEAAVEMWSIEGLHSLIRRHLTTKSTQTIMQSIVEASAEYVIGKSRAMGILSDTVNLGEDSKSESEEEAANKSNTWNAFVSEQTSAGVQWTSTHELSKEYHRLNDDAKKKVSVRLRGR